MRTRPGRPRRADPGDDGDVVELVTVDLGHRTGGGAERQARRLAQERELGPPWVRVEHGVDVAERVGRLGEELTATHAEVMPAPHS